MIEIIFGAMVGSCIGLLVAALVATIEALIENPALEDVLGCIIIAALILFGVFLL